MPKFIKKHFCIFINLFRSINHVREFMLMRSMREVSIPHPNAYNIP